MKILVLITVLGLVQAQRTENVTETWEWQGAAGWQRIPLTLKSEGSSLTGVIRMGPGSTEPEKPADFWEYFFDPVDFRISNGTVSGNRINFEHSVARPPASTPGRATVDHKFVYKGVVQADEIVITREIVSVRKDAWSLGAHKVEFVLRRVK